MIQRGVVAGTSTVLGVGVAILTNVFTDGWQWPAGLGLGGMTIVWIGWEAWRASHASEPETVVVRHTGPAIAEGPGSVANTGVVGPRGAEVRRSGTANAKGGGTANTGAMDR